MAALLRRPLPQWKPWLISNPSKRGTITSDGHELLEPVVKSYREQIASYIDLDRLRTITANHSCRSHAWLWRSVGREFAGRWSIEGRNHSRRSRSTVWRSQSRTDRQQPRSTKNRVVETKALVGLATDGDADRVGAVNEMGETMTMHDVVPLVLLHMVRNRQMTGGIVRTFSQSVLLGRIAAAHNLKIYETPIGFKYIADLMLKEDILIGAEESGGIGVKDHIPERDGLLNSLLFLEAIIVAGKTPSEMLRELHREFGEFHFGRRDLHIEVGQGMTLVKSLAAQPPAEFAGSKVTEVQTVDGVKLMFQDESWLLFRQSGTEPALRIYAEATSINQVNALLDAAQTAAHATS